MKPKFVTRADADRGFELQVIDDAGQKIDWFITVAGVDSTAYRDEQREQQKVRLARARQTARLDPSMEQIEAEALELVVAATLGWRGEDQPSLFSRDNARKAYRDLPQVAEQVDRALHQRSNFLPRSETS